MKQTIPSVLGAALVHTAVAQEVQNPGFSRLISRTFAAKRLAHLLQGHRGIDIHL